MSQGEVARALAFIEECDDSILLHRLIGDIAPRARAMVIQLLRRLPEEALPGPAEVRPARSAASRDEALRTVRTTADFSLLQALARGVGRRLEAIEIAAAAELPPGARVRVPDTVEFPPGDATSTGTVEASGTSLRVHLDDGRTWEGPPSLARLERRR